MKQTTSPKSITSGDYIAGITPEIHPVTNSRELLGVYRLHYESCQSQGQWIDREDGLWIPHPEFDHNPMTTILVAVLDAEVVGTFSLTRDGALGLASDRLYSQTNNLSRMRGRPMAEAWRFIVKPSHPQHTAVAEALAAEALRRLKAGGIATCLISTTETLAETIRKRWNAVTLVQNQNGAFLRCDFYNLPESKKEPSTTAASS